MLASSLEPPKTDPPRTEGRALRSTLGVTPFDALSAFAESPSASAASSIDPSAEARARATRSHLTGLRPTQAKDSDFLTRPVDTDHRLLLLVDRANVAMRTFGYAPSGCVVSCVIRSAKTFWSPAPGARRR